MSTRGVGGAQLICGGLNSLRGKRQDEAGSRVTTSASLGATQSFVGREWAGNIQVDLRGAAVTAEFHRSSSYHHPPPPRVTGLAARERAAMVLPSRSQQRCCRLLQVCRSSHTTRQRCSLLTRMLSSLVIRRCNCSCSSVNAVRCIGAKFRW